MVSSRYNEIYQNKRILNGTSIGFILIGIGIFFEGSALSGEFKIIGLIGLIGSFIIAWICPIISKKIQDKFNLMIKNIANYKK